MACATVRPATAAVKRAMSSENRRVSRPWLLLRDLVHGRRDGGRWARLEPLDGGQWARVQPLGSVPAAAFTIAPTKPVACSADAGAAVTVKRRWPWAVAATMAAGPRRRMSAVLHAQRVRVGTTNLPDDEEERRAGLDEPAELDGWVNAILEPVEPRGSRMARVKARADDARAELEALIAAATLLGRGGEREPLPPEQATPEPATPGLPRSTRSRLKPAPRRPTSALAPERLPTSAGLGGALYRTIRNGRPGWQAEVIDALEAAQRAGGAAGTATVVAWEQATYRTTLLMETVQRPAADRVITAMIAAGASVMATNVFGDTVMHLCCQALEPSESERTAYSKLLIEAGANPLQPSRCPPYATAAEVAEDRNQTATLELLTQLGLCSWCATATGLRCAGCLEEETRKVACASAEATSAVPMLPSIAPAAITKRGRRRRSSRVAPSPSGEEKRR